MIKNNGCCDLKYAQRLKELGVKQESEWYWMRGHTSPVPKPQFAFKEMIESEDKEMLCSAYTVAELGEMLKKINYECKFLSKYNKWHSKYWNIEGKIIGLSLSNTEANARAKMKIWLIEQEKIKI